MLVAGLLKLDAEGRVILSADPPSAFNGGTPTTADGSLSAAVDIEPDVYMAALGYMDSGALTNSTSPLLPPEGVFANARGQARVSTGLPTHWYAGIPLTADGRLAVAPGLIPPVDIGAFSNAFSNAFDALEP